MKKEEFESRYVVEKELGEGGFGKVLKAWDVKREIFVAIKRAPKRADAFTLKREYELLSEIGHHPNLLPFLDYYCYDYGFMGETEFLIMHYYEQGNLQSFWQKRKPTAADERRIIRGVLQGLSFLHAQGRVHRDLKPENILIAREHGVYIPKLADFGLGRMGMHEEEQSVSNSAIGMTVAYAAPEQLLGDRIRPNVDLWAFGVLLYKLQTGRLPFLSDSDHTSVKEADIRRQIIRGELPNDLSAIQQPYQRMIRSCLVVSREERVQTADALLEQLIAKPSAQKKVAPTLLASLETEVVPHPKPSVKKEKNLAVQKQQKESVPKVEAPLKKKSLNRWGLTAAVLLLVVSAAAWLTWGSSATQEEEEEELITAGLSVNANLPAAIQELERNMTRLEGGEFEMGCTAVNQECYDAEEPSHRVQLAPFWIGKYEVTREQFAAFVEAKAYKTTAEKQGWSKTWTGSKWVKESGLNWRNDEVVSPAGSKKSKHPITHISWHDAQAFCTWLSSATGRSYRLPTEAEWEYAAKGGRAAEEVYRYAGSNDLNEVAWYKENSEGQVQPVGTKEANGLDLKDMTGNVWEWCQDWYAKDYYKDRLFVQPKGPNTGKLRVLRGGSWGSTVRACRIVSRSFYNPDYPTRNFGFRIALDASKGK